MKKIITLLWIFFVSVPLAFAQFDDCQEEPPSGLGQLPAYSIFQENYKNGDYDLALKYGRWIICSNPETIEGYSAFKLNTQYNRMINIYSEMGRSKEDPTEKAAYIDTARILINRALDLFGDDQEEEFDLIFKRGRFFQQNYNEIEDGLQKAYSDYETLIHLNPERATTMGDGYYLRQALNNAVRQDRVEDAQELIDLTKPHASGDILNFIEEKQQEILGSPEEQIAYFSPMVEEDPNDIDAWKALEQAYEGTGDREKLKEVKVKLNELEPTYESALDLGDLAKSNANYNEAIKYYQQALDRASDDSQRETLYLSMADMYISSDRLETAREYVRRAIEIDPNNGTSYIKMGTIYSEAITNCTEESSLEPKDRVVYWLIIDYLNKAKQVDSSVTNTVNSQLSSYEAVTPSTEDKFLTLNLEDGQEIQIDGSLKACYSWINETTTVR
ncbi:tetratricopeptide repeat protein [Gracilimonas sp.]|uniref:tetratricopeptide repeat protein n=1 Tax=Gracilimonas sp. TaxID=1974203 RepID=UPI002870E6A2|nr:tetratricopeptide repeat protein [Gracilimonas sp.]